MAAHSAADALKALAKAIEKSLYKDDDLEALLEGLFEDADDGPETLGGMLLAILDGEDPDEVLQVCLDAAGDLDTNEED